jgi:hypothetical protein
MDSLRTIAVRLREELNNIPEVETMLETVEKHDGKTLTITILSWPDNVSMVSRQHIADNRCAVLAGKKLDMDRTHRLSPHAMALVSRLQTLIRTCQTSSEDFYGEVVFNQSALDRERDSILQSMKKQPPQMSLFG